MGMNDQWEPGPEPPPMEFKDWIILMLVLILLASTFASWCINAPH